MFPDKSIVMKRGFFLNQLGRGNLNEISPGNVVSTSFADNSQLGGISDYVCIYQQTFAGPARFI
jgi:hypothetical protein